MNREAPTIEVRQFVRLDAEDRSRWEQLRYDRIHVVKELERMDMVKDALEMMLAGIDAELNGIIFMTEYKDES